MNSQTLAWTVIALALVAANLPFLSNRALLVRPMAGPKPLALRLLELCLLYFLVGALALMFDFEWANKNLFFGRWPGGFSGLGVLCSHRQFVPHAGVPRLRLPLPLQPLLSR